MDKEQVLEKEIDLIQSCISRMSQNSFNIKGWLIALLLAAIALLPEKVNTIVVCLIVLGITIIFWYLDAFFLQIEKLYRWKYNWVIENRLKNNKYFYNLNPHFKGMWLSDKGTNPKKAPCIFKIMFTKTLWPIYLPIILVSVFVIFNQDCVLKIISTICK